jgi:hypothetical protein
MLDVSNITITIGCKDDPVTVTRPKLTYEIVIREMNLRKIGDGTATTGLRNKDDQQQAGTPEAHAGQRHAAV